jgi:hypothetical protein
VLLEPQGRLGARLDLREVGADHLDHAAADRLGLARVATRLLLDHPLKKAGRKGHAGRLNRLQVAGRREVRQCRVAPIVRAVLEDRGEIAELFSCAACDAERIVGVEEVGHGRRGLAQIEHAVLADRHHARPRRIARRPGASDQRARRAVGRQRRRRRQMLLHVSASRSDLRSPAD